MIYGAAVAGLRVDVGHAEGGRRPRREPEPLPAPVVRRDRGSWSGSGCVVAFGDRDRRRDRRGRARRRADDRHRTTRATLGTLPELLARGWLALGEACALGFAIATLARSQLAGIGVGIAVYFGEQFAAIFLPDVVKYLPFNAANAVVATSGSFGGGGGGGGRRSPGSSRTPRCSSWPPG